MKFTQVKKGYSPEEVDAYIDAVKREYGKTVAEQRDRIAALLEEKKKTDEELRAYRAKSSQIGKAIMGAVAKAEEIERLSRIKYNQEILRLKAFHEKWTRYYEQILDAYPLDAKLAEAGAFNRRMDKILETAAGLGATAEAPEEPPSGPMAKIDRYFAETAAATSPKPAPARRPAPKPAPEIKIVARPRPVAQSTPAEPTPKPVVEVVADYADRSPSGFSFEEALNPTEDLVDILKDLGMSEDN